MAEHSYRTDALRPRDEVGKRNDRHEQGIACRQADVVKPLMMKPHRQRKALRQSPFMAEVGAKSVMPQSDNLLLLLDKQAVGRRQAGKKLAVGNPAVYINDNFADIMQQPRDINFIWIGMTGFLRQCLAQTGNRKAVLPKMDAVEVKQPGRRNHLLKKRDLKGQRPDSTEADMLDGLAHIGDTLVQTKCGRVDHAQHFCKDGRLCFDKPLKIAERSFFIARNMKKLENYQREHRQIGNSAGKNRVHLVL